MLVYQRVLFGQMGKHGEEMEQKHMDNTDFKCVRETNMTFLHSFLLHQSAEHVTRTARD